MCGRACNGKTGRFQPGKVRAKHEGPSAQWLSAASDKRWGIEASAEGLCRTGVVSRMPRTRKLWVVRFHRKGDCSKGPAASVSAATTQVHLLEVCILNPF